MPAPAVKLRIQNRLIECYNADTGLRQGDGLAPVLFNLTVEKVIRDMQVHNNSTIKNKSYQLLAMQKHNKEKLSSPCQEPAHRNRTLV